MNIVVEGPDGGGKSTLCALLSLHTGRPVVGGEGPSKGPGEFDARVRRMLAYNNVIFDRHAAVSGPIYNMFRENVKDDVGPAMIHAFYASRPLFVYCHPTTATAFTNDHEGVDTPEYVDWLTKQHQNICAQYELWALHNAHITYRVGDDLDRLVRIIKGAL